MKFEDNLKNLEGLVGRMESGGLSLDEMIAAFEKGRKLVETCRKDLESIRLKIEKVTSSGAVESVKIKEDGDIEI
ncbi:MAG: exodeoxyribonuclease VII small subunit [Kiritimatiellae bacterium]|nr:exodeoxyribonuclease VII small subunit [Kiritimatiellia bacterium]